MTAVCVEVSALKDIRKAQNEEKRRRITEEGMNDVPWDEESSPSSNDDENDDYEEKQSRKKKRLGADVKREVGLGRELSRPAGYVF